MINQGKCPIAIIGIGCRFPGRATDSASFWKFLRDGGNAIVEVPEDRWNLDQYYDPNPNLAGKMITRWGGFLNPIDQFDAKFFGISPREALRMDPQQRWLLEVAWEAMEDGGQSPDRMAGTRTGVFIGISSNDYANIQMKSPNDVDVHTNSGSTLSIASGRISYLFDLKGPSLSVDTACSSALVAVNLACNSIWDGQCDTALAGGVNALITPDSTIGFSKASMLSPDGKCYAFDERANGYVRGEGAGIIVLKPLDQALEDKDPIYSVIRASVVNQDGRTSAMTVPGQFSQEAMLYEAYKQAGISPQKVCYMEAHGTGTPVGDPIEVLALGNVLAEGRKAGEECVIGSVKTNIGHLESASGIAGLIKAALVLKYGEIPPNLNFETPNPNIPFEKLRLRVPTKLEPLNGNGSGPVVVAVNSFGFGGTNAHVVLEEAPATAKRRKKIKKGNSSEPYLIPLSGRGQQSLKKYAESLVELISGQSNGKEVSLPDLAHTASIGKGHHDHRLALVAVSKNEVVEKLNDYLAETKVKGLVTGRAKTENNSEIVFIFTGQGPQWWAMGRELLKNDPIFRKKIEKCDRLLSKYASWSLIKELSRDESSSRIEDTAIAQPAIFALQIALADLWKARGVTPTAVIGHSVGEVAAAYCAGIYTLNDAIRIIYHRSRLQGTTRGSGRMVAVAISSEKAKELIQGYENQIAITAINSPGLVTLAGETEILETLIEPLEKEQVFVRWLNVDYAFHTHKMDPIKDELIQVLKGIKTRTAKIPFYSTVTGDILDGKKLNAGYWWRNVREAVLFGPAIEKIITKDHELFLELGPHPSHSSSVMECLAHIGKKGMVLPTLRRKESDHQIILESLAALYTQGYPINLDALYSKEGNLIHLPSYPWEHERFWLESAISEDHRLGSIVHPLLGKKLNTPSPTWECELDPLALPYLADHRLHDSMVFPGSAYVETALAALNELYPNESYVIEDVKILKGLFMSENDLITLQFTCDVSDDSFKIYSSTDTSTGEWEVHAEGRFQKLSPREPGKLDLEHLKSTLEDEIDHAKIYTDFDDVGYQFGPCFKEVQKIWRKDGESLAEIQVPDAILENIDNYYFQPAILDACFQGGKETRFKDEKRKARDNFFMPIGLKRGRFYKSPGTHLWCHTLLINDEEDRVEYDLEITDDDGSIIAEIKGFRVQRLDQSESKTEDDFENCLLMFKWALSGLPGARLDPVELLSPTQIVEKLVPEITPNYEKYKLDSYVKDFIPRMEDMSLHFVLAALSKLGWNPEKGDLVSKEGLIELLGIKEEHFRLFNNSLFDVLINEKVIRATPKGEWEFSKFPEKQNLDKLCKDLKSDFPHLSAEMALLIDCGYVLAEVLSGNTDPLDVVFPAGDQGKLEKFYKFSSDFQAYNSLFQTAISSIAENFSGTRPLRILEIGSGTGSLTESMLQVLPADRTEYFFTDISPLFTSTAKEKFKEYDFIEYQLLDIEKSPSEQNFDLHSYDLVLATNVLHATADLKQTLRHINQLMTEEGILMFLEVTSRRLFLDLVFGLLPGWWRYTDTDLRSTSALLLRQEWENLLNEIEFRDVKSFVNSHQQDNSVQTLLMAKASERLLEEELVESSDADANEDKFWLIFADQNGHAENLSNRLKEKGRNCVMIHEGESFVQENENSYKINPEQLEDMEKLFASLNFERNVMQGVIHMWSLDHPTADLTTPENLEEAQQSGCLNVLNLIQTLVKYEPSPAPRVWLITQGAQSVRENEVIERIVSAPLLGLARVANNEHNDYHWTVIDLETSTTPDDLGLLVDEVCSSDDEIEIAYRGEERYVNRLEKVLPDELPARTKDAVRHDGVLPFRLEIPTPGILNNLQLNETERRPPDSMEIEIKVEAVGLNFRDVMKVIGMYPGNSRDLKWLGDECSGTIVAVGKDVTEYQVGDDVVGMVPYCCRSYATVNHALVFPKPTDHTFEQAATLPIVFLTAHYTLNYLAHLQKGEKVLIHAGAGGVGQAAIQMAKHLGSEVFATAGSPEKREFLRDQGIQHVMDSRSLDFADEILEITEGKGVDVVLNQLAGDFITKSLSVLAPYGRFLEIGKVDIYQNTKMGLEPFKNNLSYFAVDLSKHIEERPEFITTMLREISEMFEEKKLKPLPIKSFPITESVDAFRYFAQAKHIGKNVLTLAADSIPVGLPSNQETLFRADGTYLITGGLGGFGLEVAKWMIKFGAKNLVLMGRSGASTEVAVEALQHMRNDGARVEVAKADVVSSDDVKRVLSKIDQEMPPLKGVIHAAMVLDDGFLVQIDTEKFRKVLRPKMVGAWQLHQQTKHLPLDLFVLFSSASSLIGPNGQGNYASANFFLDALAHYRNAQGLHALTINWGALSEAGYVARNENVAKYLDLLGLESFTPQEALSIFAKIIPKNPVQLGASRINWKAISKLNPSMANSKLFSKVINHDALTDNTGAHAHSFRPQLLAAPAEDRHRIVEDYISEQVAQVFGTTVDKIDRATPLTTIGLDSLMAIELMNRLESNLGISLPMGKFLQGPNISQLATPVLELLLKSDPSSEASNISRVVTAGEELMAFPLSYGQRALWFLNRLAPSSSAYNLVFSSLITPYVDIAIMKEAFASLFQTHPMLDIVFSTQDGKQIQTLQKGRSIDFREHDTTHLSDGELKELLVEHAHKPFDLQTGPVCRLELFRTAKGSHVAQLAMHHIVSDAWSIVLILNHLMETYFALKAGRKPDLEIPDHRYSDYVRWQQDMLKSPEGERLAKYWEEYLEEAPMTIDLPTDHPRPPVQTFNGATFGFKLDSALTQGVQSLAENKNVTLYTTLLSAFEILMHRYCDQEEILVGSPLHGRINQEFHHLVGYFVNPVALRSSIGDDPSFSDYLDRTNQSVIGALENQNYPFPLLVDRLKLKRDPSRSPIFQVSFAMERIPGFDEQGIAVFLIGQGGHQFKAEDMNIESIDLNLRMAQFEITLVVEEAGGNIYGCWQYNRNLFEEETINRLNEFYEQLLKEIVSQPDKNISKLNILSKKEKKQLLVDWNATTADYPIDACLHQLITEQATKCPQATALVSGDNSLTYEELERKSNGLAMVLHEKGVGPDSPVGLYHDRSLNMVVGLLGILKAGGCYVPLDPDFPPYRLELMLENAQPSVVVTQSELADTLPAGNWESVCIEEIDEAESAPQVDGLTPESLAYIIYTSGSTGKPKGVEIPHRALVNFLSSMQSEPGIKQEDKLLAVTTLSFDISGLEIYLPLISGAQIILASRMEAMDGRRLADLIESSNPTVMQATPAAWKMLLDSGWMGKESLKVLCGGEALQPELADQLCMHCGEVWNLYGPTETTIWSTVAKVEKRSDVIMIGHPIANTKIYILDENLKPLPAGFTGHLYIGGDGLARGYHHQPELTDESFIELAISRGKTERLYNTGDLARYAINGSIECIGRRDYQIKLHGYRIELGEIETVLNAHPVVSKAVLLLRDDMTGGPSLAAYIQPTENHDNIVPELRTYLGERLPQYMQPAAYMVVDEFPYTPNKKIDRKALPIPSLKRSDLGSEYVAPQTPTEKILCDILNRAFKNDKIGIHDNFFELGGDSLMAVEILSSITSAFNRELPIEVFLRNPTVESLGQFYDLIPESIDDHSNGSNGSSSLGKASDLIKNSYLDIEQVNGKNGDRTDLPQVDAVALAYIPDAFLPLTGLSKDEISRQWFQHQPFVSNYYETPFGRIAIVMLPRLGAELYKDQEPLSDNIISSLKLAAKMGASTVSLTGLIPSATDYGRSIKHWINGHDNLPAITTGHATTTATIVKTITGILEQTDRDFADEKVAIVGLGSIGYATLRLMLEVMPHPLELILCDLYQKSDSLEEIRNELVEKLGFNGSIRVVTTRGRIPDAIYDASFVLGASNVPGILDIKRIRPGTLLVDDSFPPCFRLSDAIRRIEEQQDILFTTGGLLRCSEEIKETIYLPDGAGELFASLGVDKVQRLAGRDPREITGCILSSLLTGHGPDIQTTIGPVEIEDSLAHYKLLEKLELEAARPQCEGFFIDSEIIESFKERDASSTTHAETV